VSQFVSQDKLDAIVERARKGGIEVVNLMGTSAYYAPAAGSVKMAEAILKDQKAVFCCCAYCDTEFDAGGCYVGVPAILGANGVEKVIELDLNDTEKTQFKASLDHVKELVQVVEKFM
jgi:malate dehydrogenase